MHQRRRLSAVRNAFMLLLPVPPPGEYESDGPAGRKRGQDMLVRDPDGYLVELTSVTWREGDAATQSDQGTRR